MSRSIALLYLTVPLLGSCAEHHRSDPSDQDGDGFRKGDEGDDWENGDCDDTNASIYPGADEIPYDGVDQDCSGSDLDDVDRDGFAGGAGTDCDDTRPDVSPAQVDVCGDGLDQDCSGSALLCHDADTDEDGYSPADGDCNDADPTISPSATEIPYTGVDEDCDLDTPDDDLDGDGWFRIGHGDCDDDDGTVFPGADEIPNDGIDQDCSGSDHADLDGDGYDGAPAGSDCDDTRADVNPGQDEICNDGIDQDCSGADESCLATSCLEHLLAGQTDDGTYLIAPDGDPDNAYEVYCDQTTDGGGWTLALRGNPDNKNGWKTSAALNLTTVHDLDAADSSKLSDDDINALLSVGYRIETCGYVKYVQPSCVYAHTDAALGACLTTYSSLLWDNPMTGILAGAHRGISDWSSNPPDNTIITNNENCPGWHDSTVCVGCDLLVFVK